MMLQMLVTILSKYVWGWQIKGMLHQMLVAGLSKSVWGWQITCSLVSRPPRLYIAFSDVKVD